VDEKTYLTIRSLVFAALTDTPANVQGVVVQDRVSLEGHKISDNFTFTVATSVAGIPIGPTLSGIFPLAPGVRPLSCVMFTAAEH
jgi:hypothetical protein